MATSALVLVEEYLRTSYEPDSEYVDGELVERNAGEKPHSKLQGALGAYLISGASGGTSTCFLGSG
jgi:hypothetical protein